MSDDETREYRQRVFLDNQERESRSRQVDYRQRKNNIEAMKARKRAEKLNKKRAG